MKSKRLRTLAVGLTALLLWTCDGFAAPGDAVLHNDGSASFYNQFSTSLSVLGDTLYMLRTGKDITSYKIGEDQPTLIMDLSAVAIDGSPVVEQNEYIDQLLISKGETPQLVPRYLVSGDDGLYALDQWYDSLWKYNHEKSAFDRVVKMDSEILAYPDDPTIVSGIACPMIIDNTLYLMMNDLTSSSSQMVLIGFELTNGKPAKHKIDGLQNFCAYQQGKLLVVTIDHSGGAQALSVYDPRSGALEKKIDLENRYSPWVEYNGLAYDAQTDCVYIQNDTIVQRSIGFAPLELAAYAPAIGGYMVSDVETLPGGYYALAMEDCIAVRNLDPAYLPDRTLRIHGMVMSDELRSYQRLHPEVAFEYVENSIYSAEEYVNSINNPASACDLYGLFVRWCDIERLAEKGYLGEISGNQAIDEAVARMYPNIQGLITSGGKLIGIPDYVDGQSGTGVRKELFYQLGIADEDIPSTFMELIEFFEKWRDEYAAANPGILLFDDDINLDKGWLVSSIIEQQILRSTRTGQPTEIDTPAIRALFHKMDQMDWKSIPMNNSNAEPLDGNPDTPALFSTYMRTDVGSYGSKYGIEALFLSVEEEEMGYAGVDMEVLVLSPQAAGYEPAIQVLEYIISEYPPALQIYLFPDENEPVIDPEYEDHLAYLAQQIMLLQEAIAEAEGAEKTRMTANLNMYEESLERDKVDDSIKYLVSPGQIEAYRKIHDHNVVRVENPLDSDQHSGELSTLIRRYSDGQIDGDQFIDEFAKKLRMIELEG